jgi:uncharacterized protein YjiS (DUF1127 family)
MARTPTASRETGLTIADAFPALRGKVIEIIKEWRRRASSRRDLMRLSERDLWDMRLTRADAQREASKPFWEE